MENQLELDLIKKERELTLEFIQRKTNMELLHGKEIAEFSLNLEKRKREEKEDAKQNLKAEFMEYLRTFEKEEMLDYEDAITKYKMPRIR